MDKVRNSAFRTTDHHRRLLTSYFYEQGAGCLPLTRYSFMSSPMGELWENASSLSGDTPVPRHYRRYQIKRSVKLELSKHWDV